MIPWLRVRLDASIRQILVSLERRLVEPQFNHGKIGSCRLQIVAQPQLRQMQFGLLQLIERLSEMDQHQVALMSQQRKKTGLTCGLLFHPFQQAAGLLLRCPASPRAATGARRPSETASFDAKRYSLRRSVARAANSCRRLRLNRARAVIKVLGVPIVAALIEPRRDLFEISAM